MSQNPNSSGPAKQGPAKSPAPAVKDSKIKVTVPPLFRRVDWLAALVTFLVVLTGYVLTLAPDLTLEDSGELAVGSFYAGVPHPPGYPVWTIYTWLFTVIFPFSNIAWRVALSSAVAGALSSGLLALIVSRGCSMMMEGIKETKDIDKKWESGLCLLAGYVAGMLIGFNGYMWSQAVIVEVYTLSVLSLVGVLATLLRWMYAPDQRKYLYWASFLFGICFTNHQTLIVAAMGLEVAILAASAALGRDLFLLNAIIYVFGLVAKQKGVITSFDNNPALFTIYNIVGIGSILTSGYVAMKTQKIFTEWKALMATAAAWFAGAIFYFYMPIASMTNPPMNWGYPRTEEGFWHALTRGQYDKTSPTSDVGKFVSQVQMYFEGAVEEFNFVYLIIAIIPFIFFKRMQRREKAWITGLGAIYVCLAFLLLILLNPSVDRQAKEQARVFFTASHVMISMAVGYGLALIGALIATQYQLIRRALLMASAGSVFIAIFAVVGLKSQLPLDKFNALFALAMALFACALFWICHNKVPRALLLGLYLVLPVNSILAHWSDNEQRGHLFGYWFGHDMFTPPFKHKDTTGKEVPLYPEMTKDAILFGGTDPGRFAPTYMIFCESFIPESCKPLDPKFDRRDVYIITQNALADGTYLNYIRAHYNRSAQKDPPFFVNFLRSQKEEEDGRTNLIAKLSVPLDNLFTSIGAKMEARRRREGVYPPKEIITPSPEDSQKSFQDYIADASRRLQHDMSFPHEPKQIKPGEDVHVTDGNKISVQGQVAVMAINGLLTKVIFDANPTNEFFVEESFPLDWMFPHLTPFGIIMKINRQPVAEFSQELIDKDHEFWSQYSERFIGNWITYDTKVKDICDFAKKVYLRRDFTGFKGDPKFVRDDNAQKAFSKLRSAIGGLYFYRLGVSKKQPENSLLLKEAEFALKQSFAFCPYSPEAVFKLVNLLVNKNNLADAKEIVRTAELFDPENTSLPSLLRNLDEIEKSAGAVQGASAQLGNLELQYKADPSNLQTLLQLGMAYMQTQKTNQAFQMFEQLIKQPSADANTILTIANVFQQAQYLPGMELALQRLTGLMPENPNSWYDLARIQAVLQKPEAISNLAKAVKVSDQVRAKDPNAGDMRTNAAAEPIFSRLRATAEFNQLLKPN